jgi:hypothetical protein
MKKIQLIVLWLAGLLVSGILCNTGLKLLNHAATNKELLATGYPFTLIAGTIWVYILPIVIIGGLLMFTFKDNKK